MKEGFFCPNCNYHYHDWWEYASPTDMDDEFVMPCDYCHKDFNVIMKTTGKFSTEKV
ncbi:zinc ribbon domain protein [Bacillus phage 035JT004]|nr:zinc ribbon domain protein [Bacillus phage 035JT004]